MDTFNFSFFEDKPPTGENAKESAPSPDAPAEVQADDDPFGFAGFDPSPAQPASEGAPLSPFSQAELDSLSSHHEFADPASDDDFPDLGLASPEPEPAPSSDFDFAGFDLGDAPTPGEPKVESPSAPSPAIEPVPPVVKAPEPVEIRASVEPAVFVTPAPLLSEPASATPSLSKAEPETSKVELPTEPVTTRTNTPKAAKFLTADDPYGEVAPPRERLRVAVLGASGIGKSHARWLAKHSCDVVSFLGSSDESIQLTHSHLEAHMGFEGRGFSDLTQLLSETQPQAVCIASPSPLHYAQAMQCLEAGIHVLCEKPLVYSPARSKRENMDGARELLKAAAKRNLVLATQLQYGTATPILCRLAGVSPFEVGDFAMEIETTNVKSPRDPKELWIDLAPHPLSVAQYLGGEGAEIVEETIQLVPSRSAYTSEVSARFGVRCEGGRLLMCRAIVRWFDKIVDNREPRRRFSFNGRVVQYSGAKSPDGTFIAQYVAPDGYISHYSDPVDYLVGNFVRTCWGEDALLLSSEQGVQNLNWLLSTVEKI